MRTNSFLLSSRVRLLLSLVLVAGLFSTASAFAQNGAGSVDDSFTLGQANDVIGTFGVFSVVQQTDGKVLIGGAYDSVGGQRVGPFSRLNADGSVDSSYNRPVIESYNTRTDDQITALDPTFIPVIRVVQRQDDGKVLVGGNFYFVNGASGFGGLVRLNADGSVDTGFKPPVFSGSVFALVVSGDEYIIGGDFTPVKGTTMNCVIRLKADGTVDNNFKTGAFTSKIGTPSVNALAMQPDGTLVVGGLFAQIGGSNRPGIARLTNDGTLDNSYLKDGVADPLGIRGDAANQVFSIAIQGDSKALVGGQIAGPNTGSTSNSLFRLNTDGTLDTTFNPGGAGTNGVVDVVRLESDNKILVGGGFTTFNGVGRNFFMRLLPDGTLDPSFDPGAGANSAVFGLFQQGDGKLLISGYFRLVNKKVQIFVSRINTQVAAAPGVAVSIETNSGRAEFGSPSRKGVFTVTRTGGNFSAALPVYYTIKGRALSGLDYKPLSGTVIIPANRALSHIRIKPRNNPANTGKRKLVVTLSPVSPSGFLNAGYGITGSGRGVVKIIGTPATGN